MYEFPTHEFIESDRDLIDFSLVVFTRMSETSSVQQLKHLRTVVMELDRCARHEVEKAKETMAAGSWQQESDAPALGQPSAVPGAHESWGGEVSHEVLSGYDPSMVRKSGPSWATGPCANAYQLTYLEKDDMVQAFFGIPRADPNQNTFAEWMDVQADQLPRSAAFGGPSNPGR